MGGVVVVVGEAEGRGPERTNTMIRKCIMLVSTEYKNTLSTPTELSLTNNKSVQF